LILGKVRNSEQKRHLELLCGYQDLLKTVEELESDLEFTKLLPDLHGIDPDDAFSRIPYEKGCLLLLYLEFQVGREPMLQWLKTYISFFQYKSVTTLQMKEHFENYFNVATNAKLKAIDWNLWLNGTRLPAFDPNTVLDKAFTKKPEELASIWAKEDGKGATTSDLSNFHSISVQTMVLLDTLITTGTPLKHSSLDKMDELYQLSNSGNVEVLFRWLTLCIKSGYRKIIPSVTEFLSKHGRGIYVKPLFKGLIGLDKTIAKQTFEKNKNFYHSIVRNTVESYFT